MQFLLNLHHVVYIPIVVFTAVTAMAWSVTFITSVMDSCTRHGASESSAPVMVPASVPVAARVFRPVVINGGAKALPATFRAAQMPLRSGVRAAQPYRASFGG